MPLARRRRPASALLAAGLLLAVASTGADATARPAPARGAAVQIELASQTPVVPPGGTFAVRLRLAGVPADGSILVVVHQRVHSRSELALSMDGEGLRSQAFQTATPLGALTPQPDGTRRLALSLDPASGGVPLRTEGIYPVELIAQDAAGTALATLVTHLIVPPEEGDDSPPLGVAVVAEVGAPPALQADGTTSLPRPVVADMAELVSGLVAVRDVPFTLAVTPETVDALSASAEPGDLELVDALRTAAAGGGIVMDLPYVAVEPDDLAPAGLLGELREQRERGHAVLTDALGVEPSTAEWMAPPSLGANGLGALAFSGVHRVVVSDTQVEPLEPGIISYSLAQPFLLAVPEGTPPDAPAPGNVQALATDPVVLERLATAGSPGLIASRVLAELAFLRLEQPSVARSIVLPIDRGTPATVVQLVLDGLGTGRPFAPMGLDAAFDHAIPLLDGGGNQVDRRLLPATTTPIPSAVARALTDARAHLGTFVSLVGTDSPRGAARTPPAAGHRRRPQPRGSARARGHRRGRDRSGHQQGDHARKLHAHPHRA